MDEHGEEGYTMCSQLGLQVEILLVNVLLGIDQGITRIFEGADVRNHTNTTPCTIVHTANLGLVVTRQKQLPHHRKLLLVAEQSTSFNTILAR